MDAEEIYGRTADNRRLFADLLDGLTPEQWATPSLCGGWTVRDVAGHMLMPFLLPGWRFGLEVAKARGSFDRASDVNARKIARRPTAELVAALRENADGRFAPPVVGPGGQLTDSCVHLRDAARPLGLDTSPPLDAWRLALDHVTGPKGRIGFVPRGRLDGLRLVATDQDWSWGTGREVAGPSEALALAVCGRSVAGADLTGDGVAQLA